MLLPCRHRSGGVLVHLPAYLVPPPTHSLSCPTPAAGPVARRFVGLTPDTDEFDMAQFRELLSPRTRLVATFHMSNMTGGVREPGERAESDKISRSS